MITLPETNIPRPVKKMMVGILVSFWDGLFSGAFAVNFQGGYFREFNGWKMYFLLKVRPSLGHIR